MKKKYSKCGGFFSQAQPEMLSQRKGPVYEKVQSLLPPEISGFWCGYPQKEMIMHLEKLAVMGISFTSARLE